MESNWSLGLRSEARRRVDDDELGMVVAVVPVSVRLLGSIADRIAGFQQEALVADHKFDLALEDIGDFLAFMRNETTAAAARGYIVDAALEKMGLVIGDQPFERQSGAITQRVRVDDRAFTAARNQAIRLCRLCKQLADGQSQSLRDTIKRFQRRHGAIVLDFRQHAL